MRRELATKTKLAAPKIYSLVLENVYALREGLELLENIEDDVFSAVPPAIEPHRAGSHLRHCLEFYECFLDGMKNGAIDYDARRRDTLVEHDRLVAILRTADIADRLLDCHYPEYDAPIEVRSEDDGGVAWTESTVGRELKFLRSHTIHHYALMAITLRLQGVDVPAEFGVSTATLRHRAEVEQCVR